MLDYQLIMLARAIHQERVHELATARVKVPGVATVLDVVSRTQHKLVTFLVRPVNKVSNLRYQNRHRSLEGTP